MRDHVSGPRRALSCLLLTLCFFSSLAAQQPTATTPTPPTARPGQTPQPRAPQPQPVTPPGTSTTIQQTPGTVVERKPGLPPPYYDYPFGSTTAREHLLTVDEAIRLALAQTSTYQQTQLNERIAREDVNQARAAFLPQFSMPLTYFGTTPSRVSGPRIASYVSSSAINETIALVQAQGEIDLSGRLRAALRRSRYLLEAARAGVQIARRDLVIATVDAYYGLTLARQKRRLADETLSLAEGFVKVAEGLVGGGEGEESDVLRARAEALKRRDELEQARAGEAAAMDLLRTLTGIDFQTFISITRITEDVPTVADFSSYTEEIIRNRPELALLDAQKRAAQEEVTAARRARLPQLSYSINGGFDAGDFRPVGRYAGSSAIVTLNVPVFNFGTSSRITQSRLRAQALDVQRESLLRQLRQEFYTSRAAAFSALVRIRETQAQTGAAQRNVTIILARYRQRKSSITEVVDAQAAYADARLAYYQAIVDYRTSRIRLETNLGP